MRSAVEPGAQGANKVFSKFGRANTGRRPMRAGVQRTVFGALDLGTNNCRLLVAAPTANGFRVIDAFSRIVRLGEGLATNGLLSEAAMARSIEALKVCAAKLGRRQTTRMRSVATEACRIAANRSECVDRVREETGIALDIISSAEEARLAVLGCRALFDPAAQYFLVFDIGGGSTEVTCVERTETNGLRILDWLSLPVGVVRLSEETRQGEQASQILDRAAASIRAELEAFKDRLGLGDQLRAGTFQMIGSSGTVTTLASVALGLDEYDRSVVDGSHIKVDKMRNLARKIIILDDDKRASMPCIGPDRADLLVPGCTVLETILEAWPIESLTIADRGIREGILRSLISAGNGDENILAAHSPTPQLADMEPDGSGLRDRPNEGAIPRGKGREQRLARSQRRANVGNRHRLGIAQSEIIRMAAPDLAAQRRACLGQAVHPGHE